MEFQSCRDGDLHVIRRLPSCFGVSIILNCVVMSMCRLWAELAEPCGMEFCFGALRCGVQIKQRANSGEGGVRPGSQGLVGKTPRYDGRAGHICWRSVAAWTAVLW